MVVEITVRLMGMSTPPVKPCPARKAIISPRLWDTPHRPEKSRKRRTLPTRYQRTEKTREAQAVSGIVMISPMR